MITFSKVLSASPPQSPPPDALRWQFHVKGDDQKSGVCVRVLRGKGGGVITDFEW